MSPRRVMPTGDGSSTLLDDRTGASYHSQHGAVTESLRVFMELGLEKAQAELGCLRMAEFGFGTGLNAWLTAHLHRIPVYYMALVAFPVENTLVDQLQFHLPEGISQKEMLQDLHGLPWGKACLLHPGFVLEKRRGFFAAFPKPTPPLDLVYYDAFGPSAQPELWDLEMAERLSQWLRPGGILCTYCVQGQWRRNLTAAGFICEKHPGPPGKREVLRAIRL